MEKLWQKLEMVNGKEMLTALKGNNVEIETKGNGRLYYYWQSEGISASGEYKEEDNYIKVRKRFYDRFGNPITGNTFKQNELIIVGITFGKCIIQLKWIIL